MVSLAFQAGQKKKKKKVFQGYLAMQTDSQGLTAPAPRLATVVLTSALAWYVASGDSM